MFSKYLSINKMEFIQMYIFLVKITETMKGPLSYDFFQLSNVSLYYARLCARVSWVPCLGTLGR